MLCIESNTRVVDVLIGWQFSSLCVSQRFKYAQRVRSQPRCFYASSACPITECPSSLCKRAGGLQAPWGLHLGFKAGPISRALRDHRSCLQSSTSAQESKEGDWGQWPSRQKAKRGWRASWLQWQRRVSHSESSTFRKLRSRHLSYHFMANG